ncbi:MAG: Bax inhibitor-1 family protein [Gemmatales bacterium]|nr:Bax inhibitor-1 family protein [Gemmatales bacterium]MDW8388464.1 Bax inhibitor-1 family protein [Gemmatales bacterium]
MNEVYENEDQDLQNVAANALPAERVEFIRRTYLHVAGATAIFTILLALVYSLVPLETFFNAFGKAGMLGILVLFLGGSYLSQYLVSPSHSPATQYTGLGIYILLEVLFFWPVLAIVELKTGSLDLVYQAALLTAAVAGGLTVATLWTRSDFSFLGPIISIASFVALGIIVAAILFGFTLGLVFSFAMVALMSAAILYGTSNVMYHYRTDQYVGAALYIFSAIMTLFYWIIRILLLSRR